MNTRTEKYKKIRESINEEVGINREAPAISDTKVEDDDFLSFIPKVEEKEISIEDTLQEVRPYELLKKEETEDVSRALQNAKSNIGKEEFNTRMDILNKIRNPQKTVVQVENMDNRNTQEFVNGYFTNNHTELEEEIQEINAVEETQTQIPPQEESYRKQNISLMDRLQEMSPEEDVRHAKEVLEKENNASALQDGDTVVMSDFDVEQIEKSESKKIRKQKNNENMESISNPSHLQNHNTIDAKTNDTAPESKVATILNYFIVALLVVFIVLCVMITIQIVG